MLEGNTNLRYSFASMVDSIMELFNGKISYSELMEMDMPTMRALTKVRIENLAKKRKSQSDELEESIQNYTD